MIAQVAAAIRMGIFLWCILLGIAHATAAVLPAPENCISGFFNVGYDRIDHTCVGYDGSERPSSAYDVASQRAQNDIERRTGARRAFIAPFARLLAAKTTASVVNDGLSASVRSSFAGGKYTPWVAEADTVLYRGENLGQGAGRFFGLEKPVNSLDAEMMYNIKMWGNNATQLGTYNIPAETVGRVEEQKAFHEKWAESFCR